MLMIFLSPAKQMQEDWEGPNWRDLPLFLAQAQALGEKLATLSYPQLKKLLSCNDKLAAQAFQWYAHLDLERRLTPALLAYRGIAYQYLAPRVMTAAELDYLQEHLRILSGFYGLLKPMDGIASHRLEMGCKGMDLYAYWGDKLARQSVQPGDEVVNLASAEYSRAILPHLPPETPVVTPVFGELVGERVVEKGVYVKMARGEMTRYLAQVGAQCSEAIPGFDRPGWRYDPHRSTRQRPVFLRVKVKG